MKDTTLYLYEFDISNFELQDEIAGYYVSKVPQIPKAKHQISNLFSELLTRNIVVRIVDDLWDIVDKIQSSTLNWSLIKMKNAKAKL